MRRIPAAPSYRRSGRAGMIAVLVVVMIILFTTAQTWLKQDEKTGKTELTRETDMARDAVCAANRMSIRANYVAWRSTNATTEPNQALLTSVLDIPPCPGGGVYLLGPGDTVYCTKHYPPPADLMKQMITLGKAAAVAASAAPPVASTGGQTIVPNLNVVVETPAQPDLTGTSDASGAVGAVTTPSATPATTLPPLPKPGS